MYVCVCMYMYIDYPKLPFRESNGTFLLYSAWISLSPCLRFSPLLCTLKPNSTCKNGTNCFCWGPLWEESGWARICRRDQFVISCTGGKWICRPQVSLTGSAVIFCSIWACNQKLGKMFCWKIFGWWRFLKKVSGWKWGVMCLSLPCFDKSAWVGVSYPPHKSWF